MEAVRLVLEGVAIERVDKTMEKFGFPVGPIKLMDEVGIDVGEHIVENLHQAFGERIPMIDGMDTLIADDRKGKKNGRGFYDYSSKSKGKKGKEVDPSIYSLMGINDPGSNDMSDTKIAERIILCMLNEAAFCLGENILRSARDGDIGAIFGLGFPPFYGGPFRYMDSLGLSEVVNKLENQQQEHGEPISASPLVKRIGGRGKIVLLAVFLLVLGDIKLWNLILYAVPGFIALLLIELLLEKARGTDYYRLNDALTSLLAGVLSQVMGAVKRLVPFTLYFVVYEQFAFMQITNAWWVWAVCFVFYDFCYYWNHRLGHEMNLLWAAHVVHHSSEDYNLSTALRQTSSSFFSVLFYLPMAILGFDPIMVITVGALNLIYQYWVHTQHIGKLGWFENFFISPSNHRVHHAQNDRYLDRNYGGVFILWDRAFGSYQEELETDPPIYGIRGAVKSWNPLWVNLHVYAQLWKDCWRTNNWWHKVTIWFRRTGWRPPDVIEAYPLKKNELAEFEKFNTPMSSHTKVYSFMHYVLITLFALLFVLNQDQLSAGMQLAYVGALFACATSLGLYIQTAEQPSWLQRLEFSKSIIILVSLFLLPISLPWKVSLLIPAVVACVVLMITWVQTSPIVSDRVASN